MIIRQITAIALRFIALGLLIKLTINIPVIFVLLDSSNSFGQQEMSDVLYGGVILAFIVIGSICAYLIWKVSKSLIDKAPNDTGSILNEDNQKFLIQLGGIYFIVNALVCLPPYIARIPFDSHAQLENSIYIFAWTLQLIIGILLTSRASYWQQWLLKLRGRTP